MGKSSFTAISESVLHFLYVEVTANRLVLHAVNATGREFDQAVIEHEAS